MCSKNCEVDRFAKDGLVLQDDSSLTADLVVYARGFSNNYDKLFDPREVQLSGHGEDGLYLHRNILLPRVRNLAFVGSEVSTFNL